MNAQQRRIKYKSLWARANRAYHTITKSKQCSDAENAKIRLEYLLLQIDELCTQRHLPRRIQPWWNYKDE